MDSGGKLGVSVSRLHSKGGGENDEYGNRALFLTISPETLAHIKAEAQKRWYGNDFHCEFPGGNGKLKEWIEENIRIPEGFKGSERVSVKFTVHPDGSISDPTIYRRPSKNEAVNQEALRLVNALPKFRVQYYTPKKKDIYLTLPITFKERGAIFIRGGESEIFSNPEQQAHYINGGDKGLLNDLYTTILKIAPVTQNSVKGRAIVSFKISEEGQIESDSILVITTKSVPEDYLAAAIDAIKKLGKFEPGKMNGTPLKVTYNLPIIYPVPLDKIIAGE